MRISTYNVLGLTGYPPEEAGKVLGSPDTEQTVTHFSRVFESLDCDILALQEGVSPALIRQIALAMDRNVATFPSPIAWPGHVLTRYAILESRVFSHTTPDAAQRLFSRTAGAALLALDETRRLWVVDLHLHPGNIDLRNQEADYIAAKIEALADDTHPAVVLGDLNCEIEERIHCNLKQMGFINAMETAGGGLQATMDTVGLKGSCTIDHIYFSPGLADTLTAAEVVRRDGFRSDGPQREGLWVHSDHLPVIATLDL